MSRRIVEAASDKEDHRYADTFSRHRPGQDDLSPCVFAAWLGVVPRQYSTGGKAKLLGISISKRGNVYG
jgi:hypothetical protein